MRSLGYAATRLSMHVRFTDKSGWADWSPVDETDDTTIIITHQTPNPVLKFEGL